MLIYSLFNQNIPLRDKNKLLGRVLGKFASTKSRAADFVSTIKFDSRGKVDKLNIYCKTLVLCNSNVAIKKKVYNLLYDVNIYKLVCERLKKESCNMLNLTAKNRQDLRLINIFECSLLYPNLVGLDTGEIISEAIAQMREKNYKFVNLSEFFSLSPQGDSGDERKLGLREINIALTKDILVIKAIVTILEAIYVPTFRAHKFRPSFNRESALNDIKLNLVY